MFMWLLYLNNDLTHGYNMKNYHALEVVAMRRMKNDMRAVIQEIANVDR